MYCHDCRHWNVIIYTSIHHPTWGLTLGERRVVFVNINKKLNYLNKVCHSNGDHQTVTNRTLSAALVLQLKGEKDIFVDHVGPVCTNTEIILRDFLGKF